MRAPFDCRRFMYAYQRHKVSFVRSTGVRFSPIEIINLRFGMSTEPSRYFAGVGIQYYSISVDYSVATHVELGLTHTIGISISL